MENNKKKIIYSIIAIALIGIIILLYLFVFQEMKSNHSQSDTTSSKIEVNKTLYNKISTPVDYGQAVSPDEPGYGRDDPFAPYK